MVCLCMGHSQEDIEQLMKEGNYPSVDDFQSDTFVGTGCGKCLPKVDEIFRQINSDDQSG